MAEQIVTGEGTTTVLKAPGEGPISLRDSVGALSKAREEAYAPAAETPPPKEAGLEEAPPATPSEAPEAPQEAASPEATSGEQAEVVEAQPPELPPIDPPRSWSKEDKAEFAQYPRAAQEIIARRESERERAFTRSQQEAAERAKAFEAKQAQADQVRAQYEQALPNVLAAMNSQMMGEFADIKTHGDLEKLAQEDPFRYARYDLATKKIQAAQQELAVAQERHRAEIATKWKEFQSKEDAKAVENIPELSNSQKAGPFREAVKSTLKDIGFTKEEIDSAWGGQSGISMRDHRVQELIADAVRWRQAQANAKSIAAKKAPVPPVQKPGTIRPAGADNQADITALQEQLKSASGAAAVRLATRLHQLQRGAQ